MYKTNNIKNNVLFATKILGKNQSALAIIYTLCINTAYVILYKSKSTNYKTSFQ